MPPETLFERMDGAGQQAHAHARAADPKTSHEAAAAVTPGLPELQALVERLALSFPDGFTDVDLAEAGKEHGGSTLRTRRAELTARNIVLDSGGRVIPDGHTQRHTIWIHRSFVPGAPAVREPPRPATSEDKAEALGLARELEEIGRYWRSQGLVCAARVIEAAAVMRRLAA